MYIYKKGFTVQGHAAPALPWFGSIMGWRWSPATALPTNGSTAWTDGQRDRETKRKTDRWMGCCCLRQLHTATSCSHLPQALQLNYRGEEADVRNVFWTLLLSPLWSSSHFESSKCVKHTMKSCPVINWDLNSNLTYPKYSQRTQMTHVISYL